jgi:prevent-host-death family protein
MAAHPKSLGITSAVTARSATTRTRPVVTKPLSKRTSPRDPIAASNAKAHLLRLLDEVERDRRPITITKRGRIVAQIIPADPERTVSAFDQMFGRTSGWMKITGDIVSPDHEGWGPDWQ